KLFRRRNTCTLHLKFLDVLFERFPKVRLFVVCCTRQFIDNILQKYEIRESCPRVKLFSGRDMGILVAECNEKFNLAACGFGNRQIGTHERSSPTLQTWRILLDNSSDVLQFAVPKRVTAVPVESTEGLTFILGILST